MAHPSHPLYHRRLNQSYPLDPSKRQFLASSLPWLKRLDRRFAGQALYNVYNKSEAFAERPLSYRSHTFEYTPDTNEQPPPGLRQHIVGLVFPRTRSLNHFLEDALHRPLGRYRLFRTEQRKMNPVHSQH